MSFNSVGKVFQSFCSSIQIYQSFFFCSLRVILLNNFVSSNKILWWERFL